MYVYVYMYMHIYKYIKLMKTYVGFVLNLLRNLVDYKYRYTTYP